MARNVEYVTGDNCAGLPEECEEKGFIDGVDSCLTCPDLCCPENKNYEYKDRLHVNTLRKIIERSKK